ncbi:MAG: ABC transporter ATP-binding protein [Actinomycetes bacterium]
MSPSAAVEVEHLSIRYGDTVAVDEVSFRASAGEVTVLLGPNGAGKTSILEHLEGYRGRDGGRASVLGLDPASNGAALRQQVGLRLQSGGVPLGIRPRELLCQYAGFFERPLDPDSLLEQVGLSSERRTTVRRLSGGEQQRLSLALALVGRPSVAFLDEPTAGVDLGGRELVRDVLGSLTADGVAVILTTHDLDEAERVADRIVILDNGSVVADGTTAALLSAAGGDEILFAAPAHLNTDALATAIGGPVDHVGRGEFRASVPPTPANIAALTAWLADQQLPLGDLRAGRQRLDDVFRRLTTSSAAAADHTQRSARRHRRAR